VPRRLFGKPVGCIGNGLGQAPEIGMPELFNGLVDVGGLFAEGLQRLCRT
jgi:hypothetical protein